MNTNRTGIYLVTFNMKTPINSQTGWGEKKMEKGIMISSDLVKIGKFESGEDSRRKDYKKTYGTFFQMQIVWSGNLDKETIRKLESLIKKSFKSYRHRNPLTNYPSEYIELKKISLSEVQQKLQAIITEFFYAEKEVA